MKYVPATLTIILAMALLVGCGGPPASSPILESASRTLSEAASDTLVVRRAPVALEEAEETLEQGMRIWSETKDRDAAAHFAYLTKQRVQIAREVAELKAAEEAIRRAGVERQQIQIEARQAEAERAEARALAAQQEAQQAVAQAQQMAQRIQELEAERTERGLVLTLGDVLFDVGRAQLKPGGQQAVGKLADFMSDYPERRVLVEGHTDITGSRQTNLRLSRERAEAVRRALVDQGISPGRVDVVGLASDYPVASNQTAAGRQQNRRVEIVISDREGQIPERSQ